MRSRPAIIPRALLALCLAAPALAQRTADGPAPRPPQQQQQRPAPPRGVDEEDDVVRITSNLVQLDVTVTDKSGRPVTDLRAEDFTLSEDGRPREITNFSFVSTEAAPEPGRPERAADGGPARGAGKDAPPATAAPLHRREVRRTIALVVDNLRMSHLGASAAHAAAQTHVGGGHAVEVALSPDKPSVVLGEPIYLSFEVRNLSGADLQLRVGGDYRNALGRPASFRCEAVGEDGRAVARPDAGANMGGISVAQKIPARGTYVFKLFLPHWATIDAPGEYSVTCRRSLSLSEAGAEPGDRAAWRSVEVEAATRVRVTQRDEAALGEVIEAWAGELSEGMSERGNLFESHSRASRAMKALAAIDDTRTVRHLTAVMESDSGRFDGLKFDAARALARYDTEAALSALKAAMTDEDDNVRNVVAGALAVSKHAGAFGLLVSMRRDKSYAVRMTVVHALGRRDTEESAALLRVMAGDENEMVRGEALRYLNERGAKPRE